MSRLLASGIANRIWPAGSRWGVAGALYDVEDVAVRCGVMGREMSWAVCGVAEVLGAALAGA